MLTRVPWACTCGTAVFLLIEYVHKLLGESPTDACPMMLWWSQYCVYTDEHSGALGRGCLLIPGRVAHARPTTSEYTISTTSATCNHLSMSSSSMYMWHCCVPTSTPTYDTDACPMMISIRYIYIGTEQEGKHIVVPFLVSRWVTMQDPGFWEYWEFIQESQMSIVTGVHKWSPSVQLWILT